MKRIDRELLKKYNRLKEILSGMESVLVAYSGGVDSTLLLKSCTDEVKGQVLAVTAVSPIHPRHEQIHAVHEAGKLGARIEIIDFSGWNNPDFKRNTPQRCYICKKILFRQLKGLASQKGILNVLDGENADDTDDFRPGSRASQELGIRSPLKESGLIKKDIRDLSRMLGLETWKMPSQACLASRIPYGRPIKKEELEQVEEGEKFIREMGAAQVRVRHHGALARIEVPAAEISLLSQEDNRKKLVNHFKNIGFTWVSLDLSGYRTGSLNESLKNTGQTEQTE